MAKSKLVWTHSKFPGRGYRGSYTRDGYGERSFLLIYDFPKSPKVHRISFESPEAARALGWATK